MEESKKEYAERIEQLALELSGNLSPDELRLRFAANQCERRFPRPEVGEAEREYWKKVFETAPANPAALMVSKATKQEMDYKTARKKVWALMQMRAAHISDIQGETFEWQFSDDEKVRNANLVKYFINDPTCAYPLSKGLFIYGMPGTGKTEIMQVFEKFCYDNDLSKQFKMSSMSKIYVTAKSDTDYDAIKENIQFDRAFDEFGRYVGAVLRFGEGLDINEAILEQRYERMKRYGQLTHLIANLSPNETQENFTAMIFDRIRSMCTGVYFEGESKRK